jgi:hypothetical protein
MDSFDTLTLADFEVRQAFWVPLSNTCPSIWCYFDSISIYFDIIIATNTLMPIWLILWNNINVTLRLTLQL